MVYYGLEPENEPENKKITQYKYFYQRTFYKEAGFLTLLNHLHINTKEK